MAHAMGYSLALLRALILQNPHFLVAHPVLAFGELVTGKQFAPSYRLPLSGVCDIKVVESSISWQFAGI